MALSDTFPSSPLPLGLLILLFLSLYYISTAVNSWWRLRHFRGPFLASFSNLWLFRTALSGKAYKIHIILREHLGTGLIRIGPDTLITDDPDVLQRINGVRSGYTKAPWYNVMRLDPYVHNMISSRDVGFHDDLKARTAAAYSGREVQTLESDLDEQIQSLKRLIRNKYISRAGETRRMEWGLVAQYFTLDITTKAAYGEAFGCMTADADVHGYMKALETAGFFFALCSDVSWMGRLFTSDFVLKVMGPKKTDLNGLGKIMGLAEKIVNTRFGFEDKDKNDMLSSFMRHGLSRRQCEAEVLTHLIAASDTTANFLRIALVLLAMTPHVYYRLQAEIDSGIADGRISTPITGAEGKELPYLQAFIWETLRYHPPVWMMFSKLVPPEGDTINREFVPGGTNIAIDIWSMGRRTEVYGHDVSVFRPERFLEASPQMRLRMEKTTELVFGTGRYMCAGKILAFLELNKVVVELLRDFDFQVLNPENPWTSSHRSVFILRDIWLRVTERGV